MQISKDEFNVNDFDKLLKILSDPKNLDIHGNWKVFPFQEILKFKNSIDKPGIYAITDKNGQILYIGKAKSVYNRLKSHFNATQGKEKAEAWAQFFEYFNSDLKAFYFLTDSISNKNLENVNQALERILQVKYNPLFDQIYSLKGKKSIEDFKDRLRQCNYH